MGPTELWVLGTLITVIVAALGHLYKLIFELRSDMQDVGTAPMKDLWLAMNQLRQDMENDRRNAAEHRVMIAKEMITKDDLNQQINRLIGEFDRRMTTAIRQRPPVRGDR